MSILNAPFLLGFDQLERVLDRASKISGDGYPPYNIERIRDSDPAQERLRITLAVAGFAREDLEITVENNHLFIKGRQTEDGEGEYLHRGIATRQFKRTFVLADGIEVLAADLKDGLLSIDLARPNADRPARKVEIR